MIVVIGTLLARRTQREVVAAGLAAAIAREAAARGADVQLVGRVGNGPTGDEVLLSLASDRVGHVAVLRDGGATAEEASREIDADESIEESVIADPDAAAGSRRAPPTAPPAADATAVPDETANDPTGTDLDAGDVDLALQYLQDYRVVVVDGGLSAGAAAAVVAATRWTGARLVVVAGPTTFDDLPDDATVFDAPGPDGEGAFAAIVGAYAAALDQGVDPATAFATASIATGWSAAPD